MYRYLFEETCFDRSFDSDTPLDKEKQDKVRFIIAQRLGLTYRDIRLVYYKTLPGGAEVEFEGRLPIDKNFEFRVIVTLTSYDTTLVSIRATVSRLDPVYLREKLNLCESIVGNMFKEFVKKSFYHDLFSDYMKQYEEVSKGMFEAIELVFEGQ
ncbi:MAG: hypothetical protein JW727_03945 [Candidatus Aenigmarchaeota archaeon]|nr:hypothetical protein [Candidatus Aenigmarchaeota archaeon]